MLLNDEITGSGHLELHDGTSLECSFRLHQYFDGALLLSCTCGDPLSGFRLLASMGASVRRLCGQTTGGQPVRTDGPLDTIAISGQEVTFRASCLTIGELSSESVDHRFLLTNIALPGATSGTMPTPVTLRIPTTPHPTIVVLRPHPDYQSRERLQRHHKLPSPTAILTVSSTGTLDDTADFAGHLCSALSIVQGHKINWITHETMDRSGATCYKSLHNRATKRSSGLALDCISGNDRRLPLTAAQDCHQKVREMQAEYGWNGPVLEVWLEARTDADYLETRALKFVTVVEALRTLILRNQPRRSHLSPSAWQSFLDYMIPTARFFLTAALKSNKQQVDAMTTPKRWESLNRTSFRSEITTAFKRIGVKEHSRAIELFVNSRNKLIHEGVFRCTSTPAAVKAEGDAPQDPVGEYLFIASFVDRVIMQAVGLHTYLRAPAT
jgi:hypothetical protein